MGSSVVSPCYAVTCGLSEVLYLSSRRPLGHYRMVFLYFLQCEVAVSQDVAASFLSSCRGSWGGPVRARFHPLDLRYHRLSEHCFRLSDHGCRGFGVCSLHGLGNQTSVFGGLVLSRAAVQSCSF